MMENMSSESVVPLSGVPGSGSTRSPDDVSACLARAQEELALRNRELAALHRISEVALSPGPLEWAFEQIGEQISIATGFPIVVIKHVDESCQKMVLDCSWGLSEPERASALEVPMDETLSGTVVQTGQTLIQTHVWGRSAHANRTLQRLGIKTLVVVPMSIGQRVVGALTLAHPDAIRLDEVTLRVAASLANSVALLTESKRTERALREAQEELEARVCARTADLARANSGLRREIADRLRAELALQTSEANWRCLVENAPSAILTVDEENRVLFASRGLANRTAEEMVGTSVFDLVRLDHRATLRDALRGAFEEGEGRTLEIACGGMEDLCWYSVRVGSVCEEGAPPTAIMIAADITEQRLLEEHVRQSSKMEAIGQLAGGVAHDFNNLLTVINGYSQFALRRLDSDDPLRHDLEEIRAAGERAAGLTRQLLAFSRRQRLEMRVLDINEVIGQMCSMLERLLGEDICLELMLSDGLGMCKADPGQIQQVILNLAVNARDAMPTGGVLIIETENVEVDAEIRAEHLGFGPGRYVRLAVSDTGSGMAPEVKEHLFEPFFTTKEAGEGTGLGLATVYGIVKQFGGEICVYSEERCGAVFKIYLPRVDEPAAGVEKNARAELPGGDETILVVEDERKVRLFTVHILERLGYRVWQAARGSEAMALLASRPENVDLVVTDVVLPEMSGPDFVERLRATRSDFAVLFTSGFTDHAIVHMGLDPDTSFIEKPFSVETLASKVRQTLDQHIEGSH